MKKKKNYTNKKIVRRIKQKIETKQQQQQQNKYAVKCVERKKDQHKQKKKKSILIELRCIQCMRQCGQIRAWTVNVRMQCVYICVECA